MIKTDFTLDISKFQENLNKVISESQKAGKEIADAFDKATKDGLKAPDLNDKSIENLVKSYRSAELSTKSFLANQKEISKAMQYAGLQGTKAYDEIQANIKQAEAELTKFNTELKETTGLTAQAPKGNFFAGLKKEFADGQETAKSGGGLFGGLANSLGQLISPVGLATAGIGALTAGLTQAITSGTAYNAALGDLQAKTGATGETFEKLKLAAEDAFRGGVGESVADATKIIAESQNLLGDAFSPEELGKFTTRAQVLGNLFDKDVNEVIRRASPFVKQFGLDSEQAFNLLGTAMREGGTASDDVLDSLAEYSQLAQEAGFSATEFTEALTRGAKEGLFNTDKIADSLKETQIRLKAGDFEKAFDDIIKGSTGVEKSIAEQTLKFQELGKSGQISVKEALAGSANVIREALENGQITESFASQLQVAVAGTPAEDLGTEVFNKIFGAPFDENLINEKAKQIGQQLDNAAGQYTFFERIQRGFTAGLEIAGQRLIAFANNVLQPAFEGWWVYLDNAFIKPLSGIWDTLSNAFNELQAAFKDIFGEANVQGQQFSKVMEYIGKIVGILVDVALIPLRLAIRQIVNGIKGGLQTFAFLRDLFSDLSKQGGFFGNIIRAISTAVKETIGFFGTLIDYITEFFDSLGSAPIKAPFKEVEKSAKDTNKQVDTLNKNIENPPPPKTQPVKREYSSLMDFIKTLQGQIKDIQFEISTFESDEVAKRIEKQIQELNESDLSALAKIDIEIELQAQKARLEIEQETAKLERELSKQIAQAEKELADKRRETTEIETGEGEAKKKIKVAKYSEREIQLAAQETATKIESLRELSALKQIAIIEKITDANVKTEKKLTDEKIKLIQAETDKLNELRIENIADEKQRAYLKEYSDLETKFEKEIELYKDNQEIISELQTKFIRDYSLLNDKYAIESKDTSSTLKETITDINKVWAAAFQSDGVTDNLEKQRDEIEASTDKLKDALSQQTITYAAFVSDISKLDEELRNTQTENTNNRIKNFLAETVVFGDVLEKQFAMYSDFLERDKERTKSINEEKQRIQDNYYTTKAAREQADQRISELTAQGEVDKNQTIIQSLGLAQQAFKENTLAYKVLAIAEATMATYLAATKALTAGPILGPVLAGIITAAGLANVAKIIGIGFKKGGYTGDGNTSDVAGVVHKKEYVVNAKQYSKNKDLIKAMESNNLGKYFVNEYGDLVKGIASKQIMTNVKEMKIKTKSEVNDNGHLTLLNKSINKLEKRIDNLAISQERSLNLQVEGHSKISGYDLDLITTKIKNKKAVRF